MRVTALPSVLPFAILAALSGCAQGTVVLETGGAAGSGQASGGTAGSGGGGGSGAGTTSTQGGAGGAGACTPSETEVCYDGPAGTQNVGNCKPGMKTCLADASGFGPCVGQFLPATEDCAFMADEDCDGSVNEGCACAPGSTSACYAGPAGTLGVGPCKGGTQTCLADGSGYGPCVGQVLPVMESCATLLDDDCDGSINEADAGCDPLACAGCTFSVASACGSNVAVVGHYDGGSHTICVEPGDGTPFELALMSYDPATWSLLGDLSRVSAIQVYSYEPGTQVQGAGAIPVSIQTGGNVPADPYDYAMSMGDCPAHTGYAGAVFGVPQAEVCHMVEGLAGQCSSAGYTCLAISP